MRSIFHVQRSNITAESLSPAWYGGQDYIHDDDAVPLSEVVNVVAASDVFDFGTAPYIDISSITDKGYVAEVRQVNKDSVPARAKYRVGVGDVLLSTPYAKQISVAVVPANLDGALCSSAFLVLRPHKISHFALWGYLRSEQVRTWSGVFSVGFSISRANLLTLPIPQDILDIKPPNGFDELINELAVVLPSDAGEDDYLVDLSYDWGIDLWEHQSTWGPTSVSRQSIENAVGNPSLRLDPGYLCSPALTVKIHIPYPMQNLGTIAEVVVGTLPANNDESGPPVLRTRNIVDRRLDLSDVARMSLRRAPVTISHNDILVVLTGAATGTAILVPKEAEGIVIDNNLARVRLHSGECIPQYVTAFLNSDIGEEIVRQQTIPGTTLSLPISGLANVAIPIPPKAEQNNIMINYFPTAVNNDRADKEQKLLEFERMYRES